MLSNVTLSFVFCYYVVLLIIWVNFIIHFCMFFKIDELTIIIHSC